MLSHFSFNFLLLLCLSTFIIEISSQFQIEVHTGGPQINIPTVIGQAQIMEMMQGGNQGDGEVTTNHYTVNSNRGPIHVTEVRVRRGFKNLNPDKVRRNPIQFVTNMDAMIDSMFQSMINDMINMRVIRGRPPMNNDNKPEEEEKVEDIDVSLDEDEDDKKKNEENKNKQDNNKTNEPQKEEKQTPQPEIKKEQSANDEKPKPQKEKIVKNVVTPESIEEEKNKKDSHKGHIATTDIKGGKDDKIMTSKQKKKQIKEHRKRVLFSKLCKYIFYCLILFTFYIIVKKLLELLDIIDGVKSSNPKGNKEEAPKDTKVELDNVVQKENIGKQK